MLPMRTTGAVAHTVPMATLEEIRTRLEELRGALRAENISYGELSELQGLADYIEPGDVELAEAAGIPEEEFAKRVSKIIDATQLESGIYEFYKEPTGDYLCIDCESFQYNQKPMYEGRAAAIDGIVASVQMTGVGASYLSGECTQVRMADVPKEWIEAFGISTE